MITEEEIQKQMQEDREELKRREVYFDVAGALADGMIFDPGPTSCGEIRDGVSLEFDTVDDRPFQGGWVLRFDDLERLYAAALAERGLPPIHRKFTPAVRP